MSLSSRLRLLGGLSARYRASAHAPDLACNVVTLSDVGARSSSRRVLYPLFRLQNAAYSSLPPHEELKMPALSPTMSFGNIVSWNIKEGDEVSPGDDLAEIETDKATLTWENQDDGFVAKILVPAGTKDIAVGTPVALLVEDESSIAQFANYSPPAADGAAAGAAPSAGAAAAAPAAEPAAAAAPAAHGPFSNRIGPSVRMLLETNNLEASQITPTGPQGIMTKGDVLHAVANGVKPLAGGAGQQKQQQATVVVPAPAAAAAERPAAAKPAPAGPTAAKPAAAPAGQKYIDIPNSQVRKIIAKRLLESKVTIPHLYVSGEVTLDAINDARKALKEQGKKVSVNDFVVRAVALALADVPSANAHWDEAAARPAAFGSVDVSIAVATPGGLITPIVRDANTKSLFDISSEIRTLAGRARDNKLKPEEFTGGSFTISNLGMFGIDKFSAIINPPQACIMAVGGASQRVEMGPGASLRSKSVMTVTLSADNRVYDGATCDAFLEAFRARMESPIALFA